MNEAIEEMTALAEFRPYWIEEPTSPDDILGHAAIQRVSQTVVVSCAFQHRFAHRLSAWVGVAGAGQVRDQRGDGGADLEQGQQRRRHVDRAPGQARTLPDPAAVATRVT